MSTVIIIEHSPTNQSTVGAGPYQLSAFYDHHGLQVAASSAETLGDAWGKVFDTLEEALEARDDAQDEIIACGGYWETVQVCVEDADNTETTEASILDQMSDEGVIS